MKKPLIVYLGQPLEDKRLLIPFIDIVKNKPQIGFLNRQGEIIVTPQYDYVYTDCLCESDLVLVGRIVMHYYKEGGRPYYYRDLGLIDSSGLELIEPKYAHIRVSDDKKLFSVCKRFHGYSVINDEGKEIVPFERYADIKGFIHGVALVQARLRTNTWGIINDLGEEVITCNNTYWAVKSKVD